MNGGNRDLFGEVDRMGLVQALGILHQLRDIYAGQEGEAARNCTEAFQAVFQWIDDMMILLEKTGGSHGDRG